MSQTAKPGADRYRIPVVYAFYLLQAIGIAIVYGSLLGWVGVAVGTAFLLGLVWLVAFTGRRFPRLPVAEVGNTRIEAKAGSGGGFSRKAGMTLFIVGAAVFTLGVVLEAIKLLQDYVTSGSGEGLDWMPMIRQLTISIVCLSSLSLTIRNRWRRLLFTEQGLYQVFDPTRLWAPDRDLDEPNSPLRAVTLNDWDQVVRFHWTNQAGQPTLHLHVRRPGNRVPQLTTFNFASLSDDDRRRIDDLLRKCVMQAAPPDADRTLTMSTSGLADCNKSDSR
jgi:hypothetical protein